MLGQLLLDGGVGGFTLALDVDHQLQAAVPVRVDTVALLPHQVLQRVEVEALKRDPGFDVLEVVRHEQLAVHQPHVRFDTGEAVLQCIEQGAVMFIVIVRMRLRQRLTHDDGRRLGCRCLRGCHGWPRQGGEDGDGGKGAFHEQGVLLVLRGSSPGMGCAGRKGA